MISYLRISYIFSDSSFSETIIQAKYFSAETAINEKL